MKRLIFLTCALLVAISAHSQYIINTTALRLLNGSASIAGTIPGTIYYDPVTNKFMFREGSTWVMLGSGGGSGITNGDKGDITIAGDGASMLVDNGAITFAKFQTIPTNTFLGRITAGTGLTESLTPAQAASMLPVFTSSAKGLVPVPTSTPDGTRYLNDQGTFTVPPGSGGAGTGTTETASNGLTKVGDDIRLGGALTEFSTMITLDGNDFEIRNGISQAKNGFFYSHGTNAGWHIASGDYTGTGSVQDFWIAGGSGLNFLSRNATTGNVQMVIGSTGTTFTDSRNTKRGIEYAGPGYETQPYSLTTKNYVDQLVASVSNIAQFTTSTSGVVPASGTSPSTKILYGDGVWRTAPTSGATYSVFTRSVSGLVPFPGGSTTTRALYEDGTWKTVPVYTQFSATQQGLVPPSGTADGTKVLYDDKVWRVPPASGGSGTVTTDAGQVAYGVGTDAVGGEAVFTYNATTNLLSTGNLQITNTPVNNPAATQMLVRNAGSSGNVETLSVGAGSYTPTYTAFSGSPNGFEAYPQMYMRVGNRVTVSGVIDFDHTSNSPVSFKMTLPPGITPAMTAIYSAGGGVSDNKGGLFTVKAEGSAGNEVYFDSGTNSVSGTSTVITYTLMYACAN